MTTIHNPTFDTCNAPLKDNIYTTPLKLVLPKDTDPLTRIEHTDLETDILKIQEWLKDPNSALLLELVGITFEELERLEDKLRSAGLKIKYDWSSEGDTALFHMPSNIHEIPGSWLAFQIPMINEKLEKVARCGRPEVYDGRTGTNKLPLDKAYRPQADEKLSIHLHFNEGMTDDKHPPQTVSPDLPRVVLETTYSETQRHVMDKVGRYLWCSKRHIHAVIVCEMSYRLTLRKNFSVTISIYTRPFSDIDKENYPQERTKGIQHTVTPLSTLMEGWQANMRIMKDVTTDVDAECDLGERETMGNSPLTTSPTCSSATATTGDTTRVEEEPFIFKDPKGIEHSIHRRFGPVCVYDDDQERFQRPLPNLKLNVYDFLRVCPKHPRELMPDLPVELPLESLAQRLQMTVETERHELRKGEDDQSGSESESESEPEDHTGEVVTHGRGWGLALAGAGMGI